MIKTGAALFCIGHVTFKLPVEINTDDGSDEDTNEILETLSQKLGACFVYVEDEPK